MSVTRGQWDNLPKQRRKRKLQPQREHTRRWFVNAFAFQKQSFSVPTITRTNYWKSAMHTTHLKPWKSANAWCFKRNQWISALTLWVPGQPFTWSCKIIFVTHIGYYNSYAAWSNICLHLLILFLLSYTRKHKGQFPFIGFMKQNGFRRLFSEYPQNTSPQ